MLPTSSSLLCAHFLGPSHSLMGQVLLLASYCVTGEETEALDIYRNLGKVI